MKTPWAVVIGILGGLLGAGALFLVTRLPQGEPIPLLPAPTLPPLVVHVSGAVAQPGVYELPDGARVRDAVEAAGGFLPQADLQKANLAARVQDGERLQVLSLPPTPLPTSPISATAAFVPTSEPEQVETSTPAGPIDINLASLEELDSLPGIGPVLASRIIAYREEHGPFSDPAAIMEVSGIGPAKYADIQNLIAVSGAP